MNTNQNHITRNLEPRVLFVDMNSFFASCEQQENYYLRGRPVVVCVYTGKYGCVIAPSIEAKKKGVKLGMRLNEAIQLCPELVPLETHPNRYREFHKKIMNVLRKYSADVIPKSIDEAVVNLIHYKLIHNDVIEVAKKIKQDICSEVGDYLKCSIGIAPNEFLAKLASDIQKPDGLTVISSENIDSVLSKLTLTDLPGIAKAMALRLKMAGIETPLQLRHTPSDKLKRACNSVVGLYWHYRLNFSEVDMATADYKSMQAMRQISKTQRKDIQSLNDLLISLCTTLEKRMVKQNVYCREISFFANYENDKIYKEHIKCENPVQGGTEILKMLKRRMCIFEKNNNCEPVINNFLTMLGVNVFNFINADLIQCDLFENRIEQHNLRQAIHSIRDKFGNKFLVKAAELREAEVMKDAIGFGSVKHLY